MKLTSYSLSIIAKLHLRLSSKFQDLVKSFVVPPCPVCPDGGTVMPDVVFFGDNVPKDRVEAVRSQVSKASALLVVGSSLYVFSGYRCEMSNDH